VQTYPLESLLWSWHDLGSMYPRPQSRSKEGKAHAYWSLVAALLAINRLCAPGIELAIEQRWYPSTALGD
jgi:hypothetical protein